MKMTQDEKYMKAAIREAKKAYALDEVPIGCVIVQDGTIIARGYNRRNTEGNTLAHAELAAIRKASKKTGDWRLEDCTMYVTLEPCQMCAGAIVQSRMKKVVIATMNPKAGCAGSVLNLLQMAAFNHQVEIEKGVLEEECSMMLSDFFRELREKKRKIRRQRQNPFELLTIKPVISYTKVSEQPGWQRYPEPAIRYSWGDIKLRVISLRSSPS